MEPVGLFVHTLSGFPRILENLVKISDVENRWKINGEEKLLK